MAEKEYIEREAAIDCLHFVCVPQCRQYAQEEIKKLPAADVRSTECCEECRDALLKTIDHYKQLCADARPVVRGKWVAEKEDVEWGCSAVRYRCSHCGRLPHFDKESYKFLLSDYCPKCGADMREADDEKA